MMTGPSRIAIRGLIIASIASSFLGFGPSCTAARASPPFSESLSHVADKYTREIEAIHHVRDHIPFQCRQAREVDLAEVTCTFTK